MTNDPRTANFRPLQRRTALRKLAAALLAAGAFLIPACGPVTPRVPPTTAYREYDLPAKLPRDPSAVRVKVSLDAQRAYVTEGGRMLLAMPVSVGAPETPTPVGNFRITRKDERERARDIGYARRGDTIKATRLSRVPRGWSFTGSPLPYWCEFAPNLAFHTGWIRHHPVSDGCLRMHQNLAPKFFRIVAVGTPVEIARSQPEDDAIPQLPLPPDAGPLPPYPAEFFLGDGYYTRHQPPVFVE